MPAAPRKRPEKSQKEPPGEFLSDDLREETARFLDAVKRQIERRKEAVGRPKLGPPTKKKR